MPPVAKSQTTKVCKAFSILFEIRARLRGTAEVLGQHEKNKTALAGFRHREALDRVHQHTSFPAAISVGKFTRGDAPVVVRVYSLS